MIPVYICEDIEEELKSMFNLINETINRNGLQGDIKIVCATKSPAEVLKSLKNDMRPGIYFLDYDLGNKVMNGIELGINIRVLDPLAYIAMVTTHSEAAPLTYKYMLNARDYILKDRPAEIPERIKTCLVNAHNILLKPIIEESRILLVRKNGEPFTMYTNQIYFIEVAQDKKRRLDVHENYGQTEVMSTLSEVLKQLGNDFCYCNKSVIINLNHVKAIDRKQHKVYMKNGFQIGISIRNAAELEKRYLDFLMR